jgi:hypothetical protein
MRPVTFDARVIRGGDDFNVLGYVCRVVGAAMKEKRSFEVPGDARM